MGGGGDGGRYVSQYLDNISCGTLLAKVMQVSFRCWESCVSSS